MVSKYQSFRVDRQPVTQISFAGNEPTITISTEPIHKPRTYINRSKHPECQSVDIDAGFRSVLLKQLEINEELLHALIDIEIANLSKAKHAHMKIKYGHLI